MKTLTLLALAQLGATATLVPDNVVTNYSLWATRLRRDLLREYDLAVPPMSERQSPCCNYSITGTDVYLQIRFFKVDSVRMADGRMRAKVWVRMTWRDMRLRWNPASYGGISSVRFHAASFAQPENSEIWLPDVTPYNARLGLMHSLESVPTRFEPHSDHEPAPILRSCSVRGPRTCGLACELVAHINLVLAHSLAAPRSRVSLTRGSSFGHGPACSMSCAASRASSCSPSTSSRARSRWVAGS